MARIVSMVSGKGGTGKTTLCATVAACLAMQGHKVLCVDLDMGLRNLDIALGMTDEAVIPFTSVLEGTYSLEQAAKHPTIENLYLLTAPVLDGPESVDPAAFAAMMDKARSLYDFVLLDAPAGVGPGFQLAVSCADEALLICLGDPASIRDAARTAELLFALPLRLVVNRVRKKVFTALNTTVDDIMDTVGLPLLGVVPDDEAVILAAAAGVPLTQYTFHGASEACLNIAKRLCGLRSPLMRL